MIITNSVEETAPASLSVPHTDRNAALGELARAAVSLVFGVRSEDMLAPSRCRAPVAQARQIAMYLTHVSFGVTLSEVGRVFGRDRTTASHACHVIEDRREDDVFDARLQRIEAALTGFAPRSPRGEPGRAR